MCNKQHNCGYMQCRLVTDKMCKKVDKLVKAGAFNNPPTRNKGQQTQSLKRKMTAKKRRSKRTECPLENIFVRC